MTAEHYAYSVAWSDEDGEYVGLCAEFPLMSFLAPTEDGALTGIRQLTGECVSDMLDNDETPPAPIAEHDRGEKRPL